MGLLSEGKPLSFNDAIEHLNYIRQHGIVQFLNTWNRVKDVKDDELRLTLFSFYNDLHLMRLPP